MGVPEELAGLDLAAALNRVGGDEELLKEIAGIFIEECPDAVDEVRKAVAANDPEALQHSAHTLKGSVANFGAQEAYDAALRLEMMGRQRNLNGSTEALVDLERTIAKLKTQLGKLTGS